jgi:uncharacterized membrane protein
MENKNQKNILLGLGIIISFVLLILSITLFFSIQQEQRKEGRLTPKLINEMTKEEIVVYMSERESKRPYIKSIYLYPFFAFIGMFIGSIVYYIMTKKINKQNKFYKHNTRILLTLLPRDENKIIQALLKNKGTMQQYELTYLPNLNKVKAHRILKDLEQKEIILKQKFGKVNKITLNRDLYNILKNKN